MTSSDKLNLAKLWLEQNHNLYLSNSDSIERVVILTADIRRDPAVSSLGMTFGPRYEIRPHLFVSIRCDDGSRKIGIVEISENALGLTTLGVMQAYSRLAEPDYSIILCEKSLSRELLDLKSNPNYVIESLATAKIKK